MNEKDFFALEKALRQGKKILVSACLLGVHCRYDSGSNLVEALRDLMEEGFAIPVCPEVLSGLPTPRAPSEIIMVNSERKVYNDKNTDVTESFELGVWRTLETAKKTGAKIVIFKSKSPSCGFGTVYDGTFTKTLTDGNGITATLLKENGIRVINEEDYLLVAVKNK